VTYNYYDLFQSVSGAPRESILQAKQFFSDLPGMDGNLAGAASTIRNYIIAHGFSYDDRVFTLQDILTKKAGNCLGLTLFIAVELLERGLRLGFRIVTHPLDAVHSADLRLFEELCRGDHFDYDDPILPRAVAQEPMYRFGPLEHPLLVLDGQEFDLTNLDTETDPTWTPPAEKRVDVDFSYIASCVLVDRAQVEFLSNRFDYARITQLCMDAVAMRRDCMQAWELMWYIGARQRNRALKDLARKQYLNFTADDSRYHYNVFEMTRNQKHLDLALDRFPAYLDAFFERHVVKARDPREKRFNFAVSAWCVANSCVYKLHRFYDTHRRMMKTLFGDNPPRLEKQNRRTQT
jgi:hypothetical protein